MKRIDIIKLIVSVAVPLVAGLGSSVFTINSISTWYAALNKPWFNPPNAVFGPVWTILYIFDGTGVVPHTAIASKSHTRHRDRSLHCTAHRQRHLDVRLFRAAEHTVRPTHHRAAMDTDRYHHLSVLQGGPAGLVPARAAHRLGDHRHRLERVGLPTQPVTHVKDVKIAVFSSWLNHRCVVNAKVASAERCIDRIAGAEA